uniref:Putative secreted protein n=1 Tax=Rhipicephalus microplus TaxID=6941 RepID=A0A6M2DCD8_RHIMP
MFCFFFFFFWQYSRIYFICIILDFSIMHKIFCSKPTTPMPEFLRNELFDAIQLKCRRSSNFILNVLTKHALKHPQVPCRKLATSKFLAQKLFITSGL